jgi:uncharacterized LabA/DUF88 family protein
MYKIINRTVIFIDGQNFKKNLRTFAFSAGGREYRLDEKHFQWQKFFTDLISKFDRDDAVHSLVRVYWYNADDVTSWREYPGDAQSALRFCRSMVPTTSMTEDEVRELAHSWWQNEREIVRKAREDVFPNIQQRVEFLEFRYTGIYKIAPFRVYDFQEFPNGSRQYLGSRVGEKGVDLGIAVDMIGKMPGYDAAILLSGDADFMPVVRHLKDNLKSVYQFSIAKGVPPNIQYLSADLKVHVDAFRHFDELELLRNYLDRSWGIARIPPPIVTAIDTRIAELEALTV